MRRFRLLTAVAVGVTLLSGADWPMPGGNPQHNGWAGSERLITKANVGELKLLYRVQAGSAESFAAPTSPMVVGNLITYLGFKEMLMFTAGDTVFSIDADLNRTIWKAHLPYLAKQPADTAPSLACPGGTTSPVITEGSSSSSLHFAALASQTPAVPGAPRRRPNPYLPPLAESIYPLLPTTLTRLNAVYTVNSDGYMHVVNSSTGEDLIPAIPFLPPGVRVTGLNVRANDVYATTGDNCDGRPNTVYSIDLISRDHAVHSFSAAAGGFAGQEGAIIGNDETVYVQTAYAPDGNPKHSYEAVLALTPRDLRVKDYFILDRKPRTIISAATGIDPVIFSLGSREIIVAGGSNGRIYLLDSKSLGGTDHKTPLFATTPVAGSRQPGSGFRGSFSTWLDVETGIRRLYAPVFGGLSSKSEFPNGASSKGSDAVVALAVEGSPESPTLRPLWAASSLVAPAPVVIGNGMTFVLSTGDPAQTVSKKRKPYSPPEFQHLERPATLHIFDADTGKPLYATTAAPVSSPLSAGLALANGRLYFGARDNAVYCFGIPAQQSQLTAQ